MDQPHQEGRRPEGPVRDGTPSLADKLNALFAARQASSGTTLTNRMVAEGVTARGVSISETLVHYLRTGKRDNPTKKHLEGIAHFFGVPPGHFFDDQDDDADHELWAAVRDKEVRAIALRSSRMTPAMRQWLAETIAGLDEAQEVRLPGRRRSDRP
jgi:transcriptional regulator with XRE-family HTH domain